MLRKNRPQAQTPVTKDGASSQSVYSRRFNALTESHGEVEAGSDARRRSIRSYGSPEFGYAECINGGKSQFNEDQVGKLRD